MLQNVNNVDGWNLLREELKEAILSVLKNGPYYTAKPDASAYRRGVAGENWGWREKRLTK